MSAHFQYLKQALADGILLMAGSCLDRTFGVGLLRFETGEQCGVRQLELHPFKLSLWTGSTPAPSPYTGRGGGDFSFNVLMPN